MYFSAALNREPKHFEMLKSLGLHADHVHQASAHEMLYQCVMRTSLRDPASSAIVHAIVPDEPSAMRLAHLVGTKQVSQLGAICAPPRPALTDIQRRQRHEASKAIARLYAPKTTRNWYINEHRVNPGTFLPASIPSQFTHVFRDAPQRGFCRSSSRTSREGTLDQRLRCRPEETSESHKGSKGGCVFLQPLCI